MERITYRNNHLTVVGNLFFPDDFDCNKSYPALIFTHPAASSKEKTAGIYAEKIAHLGYITLAFDAAYQGESSGTPRFLEDPQTRTEDIRSGIDFLTTLPYVNNNRIGAIGVCAGAGYTLKAAQTDKRIKAVAGISPADIGLNFREGWSGGQDIALSKKVYHNVSEQRTAEANGAELLYVSWNENIYDDIDNIRKHAVDISMVKPQDFAPVLYTSFDRIQEFHSFDDLTYLEQPLMLLAGDQAFTKWQAEKAYDNTQGDKELVWIHGAEHVDLYDVEPYVSQVVSHLKPFLEKNI